MRVVGFHGLLLCAVRIDYRHWEQKQEAPRKVCPDSTVHPALSICSHLQQSPLISLNREKSSEGNPPPENRVLVSSKPGCADACL